jgi:frataxin-like iron-binding protein CyaY
MKEDSLDVGHKSGQVVRISLDDRTQYYLNRKPESRQIVLRDTRVTVDVESDVGGKSRQTDRRLPLKDVNARRRI